MRKLLLISLLYTSSLTQAQFKFNRADDIVVKNGSDTLKYAWAGGMNFCQFSSIDLNLDGIIDLFAFDRTFNQPLTFINKGTAGQIDYVYEPSYETLFPSLMNWVLLRDYNCDGKIDVFGYSPGGIKLYKNVSDTSLKFELVTTLLKGTQCTAFINIYVSSVDIPSIEDIDYDGDLDVLTFGIFGNFVEYHKNYSVELGYGCDSLKFTMKNQCWGHFKEDNDSCIIYLYQTQPNCAGVGTAELAPYDPSYEDVISDIQLEDETNRALSRHTGSTILAIDMNGINSKDIILSDISCKNMEMLTNGGIGPNLDSDMILKDETFPSYDIPIDIELMPAAYYVDVNNDNNRDLICAPNSYTNSNNTDGNWLYLNSSADSTPIFAHTQYGFMQNEMVEHGEGALPVFFDYNMDGLKDLVVSNYGHYTPGGTYTPKFALYQNTGTLTQPTYTLVNSNYASVFAAIGKVALYPTFGDLDNDGDEDMIVGDIDGNIHYFTNTAGAGFPAVFSLTTPVMVDNDLVVIDVGKHATPTLVDIDRDGDLDLVIGEQNAVLNYLENTGTPSSYEFTLLSSTFGGVDVSENWTIVGYSVPTFFDNNGEYVLFVGAQHGIFYQYDSIDGNLTGNFNLIDSACYTNKVGGRAGIAIDFLNNDTIPDFVMGNYRGGLSLYYGINNSTGSSIEPSMEEINFTIFPNPATNTINIQLTKADNYTYKITDLSGKLLLQGNFNSSQCNINLHDISNGVYIIQLSNPSTTNINHKIIKCSNK